jgi:leucyl/phenylalanyl-tRNA--protein transferase
MIPWLAAGQPFPDVSTALRAPNGLLAASSDLTTEQLIAAYSEGIFPWYSEGEPVLKGLRRSARDPAVEIWIDRAFSEVMHACAAPRSDDVGTWITPDIVRTYGELHSRGLAHSVETWIDGELVGGLYGVALGRMFFGESMFARASDASKIALAALVQILRRERVPMIDCQQNTRHLASLGGREIARHEFTSHVRHAVRQPPVPWAGYRRRLNEELAAAYGRAD